MAQQRTQNFNKIRLTTSNDPDKSIILEEISGKLHVNNLPIGVSGNSLPSLEIESHDSLPQIDYSQDSIVLEGVNGHLYSNGTDLQSPTFTGLSDTPNSFVSGKYLRVNDAGDALEYVDITGVSSGGDSGGSSIVFDGNNTSQTLSQGQVTTIDVSASKDTYSAYTNGVWRAPHAMDVIVNGATILAHESDGKLLGAYAYVRDADTNAYLGGTTSDSRATQNNGAMFLNSVTMVSLTANQGVKYDVVYYGGDSTHPTSFNKLTIAELGSGGSSGGGIGQHNIISTTSKYDGLLPDKIILSHLDDEGEYVIVTLRYIGPSVIQYTDEFGDGFRVPWNNDSSGSWYNGVVGSHLISPISGNATPSIKDLVDAGYGVFLGGSSGGDSASGGGNYEFCKSYLATNQSSPGNAGVSPINLNSSSLETQSQDWTYSSSTYNKTGIKIPTDGLYNIIGEGLIDFSSSSTQSDWQAYVVNHNFEVRNDNGDILAFSHNNKEAGNGEALKANIYTANVYLTAGTLLTVHSSHFRSGGAGNYQYDENISYLNVEKSSGDSSTGDSSTGGGGLIHARFSGSTGAILTKSSNWDTYVDSITFPQGSWNGYLRINYKNDFTTVPTTLATADHRESVPNVHVFAQVQAVSVSNCDIVIGDTEKNQVGAEFNVAIFSDEIAGGTGGSTDFVSLTDTPSDFTAGKYLRVNDAGDALEYVDISSGGSGGSTGVSSTSGSGSYASISTISDNLSFSYNFPDALLVPLTRGGSYQERIFPFVGVTNANATSLSGIWNGDEIFSYELSMGPERFILIFNNDTSGTLNTYTEVGDTSSTDIIWSEMSPATTNQPTLKEFIDADRAIYYK